MISEAVLKNEKTCNTNGWTGYSGTERIHELVALVFILTNHP